MSRYSVIVTYKYADKDDDQIYTTTSGRRAMMDGAGPSSMYYTVRDSKPDNPHFKSRHVAYCSDEADAKRIAEALEQINNKEGAA